MCRRLQIGQRHPDNGRREEIENVSISFQESVLIKCSKEPETLTFAHQLAQTPPAPSR